MKLFSKFRLSDSQTQLINDSLEKSSSQTIDVFLIIITTVLCCIGVNFNQEWAIILSMILYPIVGLIAGFIYSLINFDKEKAITGFLKIVITMFISIVVAVIYFAVSPFSIYTQEIFSLSRLSISIFFAEIVVGMMLFRLILSEYYTITKAVLSVISSILLLLCIGGISIKLGDTNMLFNSMKYMFLSVFFVILGILISSLVYKVNLKENHTVIPKAILGVILIFGLYFGAKEIYSQTTNFNVEQYVYKELENRSFSVSNIEVDKPSKKVVVYYSGIKPAIAQDQSLKKKYKLKNYHFVFESVK